MEAMLFKDEPKMKVTALASWFGSNRMLAPIVGKELTGCSWVGIPFAGGMSELAHIKASTIVVSDLHRHVINLAIVAGNSDLRPQMLRWADSLPFHPNTLAASQQFCSNKERDFDAGELFERAEVPWAVHYFVCCWMGRSAKAGTDDEFKGGLPVRWSASGGDSNTRYRSAIESLEAWGAIMRRCNFVCQDVFKFLSNVKDEDGHGLYLDAPWPEDGDKYKHKFSESQQRQLASELAVFERVRVVVRYGDHPLIRELYPAEKWRRMLLDGRCQANKKQSEVLLIRN